MCKELLKKMVDRERGGFYGRITGEDVLEETASKGAILNARILWTFSAAYRLLGKREYLETATRAKRYLIDYFYDPEFGGVYWELDCQGNFRKFGTHSKYCRNPHPENSTRTTNCDRTGNSGNISRSYRCRKRRTHCLERSHRAVGGILFAEDAANDRFDGIGEFPELQKACPHTEQQPHADDAHHGGNAPDKVVDCLVDSRDRLQHMLYPYFPLQIS